MKILNKPKTHCSPMAVYPKSMPQKDGAIPKDDLMEPKARLKISKPIANGVEVANHQFEINGKLGRKHILHTAAVEIKNKKIAESIQKRNEIGFVIKHDAKVERWYLSYNGHFDESIQLAMILAGDENVSEERKFRSLACLNNAIVLNPESTRAQHLRGLIARDLGFADYMSSDDHIAAQPF